MTSLARLLNKPEYMYQPGAMLRRAFVPRSAGGYKIVRLPWGLNLEVNLDEAIGRTISHHGLFEMSVVEAIFRLTDPIDTFLDVGANIGFMSAVAISAGAKTVISFEPHPLLFERLSRNVSMWIEANANVADRVYLRQIAISQKEGTACLKIPEHEFMTNQGVSSLEVNTEKKGYVEVQVPTITLDQVIDRCSERVGVLKIDIEGHEIKAFGAGRKSLEARRVRDVIFEDHAGMNSDVSRLLNAYGYKIFGLNKTLLGPVLLENQDAVDHFRARSDEALNFLATLDPARARARMSGRGYMCLRAS